MDRDHDALDCPLCGTPVAVDGADAVAVCPLCCAVGMPMPGIAALAIPGGSRRR